MDILRLLAGTDEAVPVPERRLLRRFRNIVSDLGDDLYVAIIDERPVGFVQITYRRHITLGLRGRVEALVVQRNERAREVTTSLIALVEQRARRRGCSDVSYTLENAPEGIEQLLVASGWARTRHEMRLDLSTPVAGRRGSA